MLIVKCLGITEYLTFCKMYIQCTLCKVKNIAVND